MIERRLLQVAPPGLGIVDVRVTAPDERRLGQLIAAADYAIALEHGQLVALQDQLPSKLAAASLPVTRIERKKKRRKKNHRGNGRNRAPAPPGVRELDARPRIIEASVDAEASLLRLRLRMGSQGGARPREVVEALLGEPIADHRFCRERLLIAVDDGFVTTRSVGPHLLRPIPVRTLRSPAPEMGAS